ncbi:MAG TPA: UdgX family uracil-DNA binding protein [Acidobacteriaceae bacterium]
MTRITGLARPVYIESTLAAWREAARPLLMSGVHPLQIDFVDSTTLSAPTLFTREESSTTTFRKPHVSAIFLDRAETVACHRSRDRWNILYRLLWRLQQEPNLLRIEVDDDVRAFRRLESQVHRDLHKMHAFVRFRRIEAPETPEGEAYIAWYEPDHRILPLAAPFFRERFSVMRWSILSPDASMHWNPTTKRLTFSHGVPKAQAPQEDEYEDLWRTYYGSIFNPARTNLRAMRSEMPSRYWKNLPEIEVLPKLLDQSEQRVGEMIARQSTLSAASFVPKEHTLPILREAIPQCRGCELHACATQAVFGVGPVNARLMLIGEQPGDEEDLSGQPFVGPAGRLLDELLTEAEINRRSAYITNAVKHLKFVQRGKLRLHQSPKLSEINACRPWLLAELDAIQPTLIVCLGATAAKSLLGGKFALMRDRGTIHESPYAPRVLATLHPSAILRAPNPTRAAEMRAILLTDLKQAKFAMETSS